MCAPWRDQANPITDMRWWYKLERGQGITRVVNHWMDTDQYLVNDGLAVGSKNARLSQVLYICVSLDKNKCMPTVFSIGQIQLSAQSLGRALPTCSPPVSCPLNSSNGHCSCSRYIFWNQANIAAASCFFCKISWNWALVFMLAQIGYCSCSQCILWTCAKIVAILF